MNTQGSPTAFDPEHPADYNMRNLTDIQLRKSWFSAVYRKYKASWHTVYVKPQGCETSCSYIGNDVEGIVYLVKSLQDKIQKAEASYAVRKSGYAARE